jgi:hypothetical protein
MEFWYIYVLNCMMGLFIVHIFILMNSYRSEYLIAPYSIYYPFVNIFLLQYNNLCYSFIMYIYGGKKKFLLPNDEAIDLD